MEINQITWRSPSNIALIKYWGKRDFQLPMNPSLSLTLRKSFTESTLLFRRKERSNQAVTVQFYYEGRRAPSFECKVRNWLELVESYFLLLKDYDLKINSFNSFPHSAGIASSASSFSSLALCLCAMEKKLTSGNHGFEDFSRKASFISRMGSGSAARSAFGEFAVWGHHHQVQAASDEYAVPLDFKVHENFNELCDSILVVSSKAKRVSSTKGHRLMLSNPYAELRYKVAELNFTKLISALQSGDYMTFINIVENEALNLHAMFMTSSPGFVLASSGTLEIINRIKDFRNRTGLFVCFTLDAGPNVHLLYPKRIYAEVQKFILSELSHFCEDGVWIDDEMGHGPEEVTAESMDRQTSFLLDLNA